MEKTFGVSNPRGSLLTLIAALAPVETPNASLALICKYDTDSLFWLPYIFLFIFPLLQMFPWFGRTPISNGYISIVHLWLQFLCFRDLSFLFQLRVIRLELSVRLTHETLLGYFCLFSSPSFSESVAKLPGFRD